MKESRFAVIGLGRFGSLLVRALSEEGMEVIAVDRNQHAVEAVKDYATVAVAFDSITRARPLSSSSLLPVQQITGYFSPVRSR